MARALRAATKGDKVQAPALRDADNGQPKADREAQTSRFRAALARTNRKFAGMLKRLAD